MNGIKITLKQVSKILLVFPACSSSAQLNKNLCLCILQLNTLMDQLPFPLGKKLASAK